MLFMRRKLFLTFLLSFCATSIFAQETTASFELQKDGSRTIGRARGLLSEKDILLQRAYANALANPSDTLLEAEFFQEENGDSLSVTVTGFSARYRRVSPSQIQNAALISTVEIQLPNANNNFAEPFNKTPLRAGGRGFYFSAKGTFFFNSLQSKVVEDLPCGRSSSRIYPEGGFNIAFGGFTRRFLLGGDFGFSFSGRDTYRYPLSGGESYLYFGYRTQPKEWLQIIPGISYGMGTSSWYTTMGGFHTKALFGRNKTWFEVAHRWLIFDFFGSPPNQIMMGFTRAPTRFPAPRSDRRQ